MKNLLTATVFCALSLGFASPALSAEPTAPKLMPVAQDLCDPNFADLEPGTPVTPIAAIARLDDQVTLQNAAMRRKAEIVTAKVVRIMWMAAESDGAIAQAEARRIGDFHQALTLLATPAALRQEPSLLDAIPSMNRDTRDFAIRGAVTVIVADGGINADEQVFIGNLAEAAKLSPAAMRRILQLGS